MLRFFKGNTNVFNKNLNNLNTIKRRNTQSQGNEKSPPQPGPQETTHFGFQNIPKEQKQEKVKQVFENVASVYDKMNDAMSAGLHRVWKDRFIEKLYPLPGVKLLDVAGGTGDIAFRFLHHVKNSPLFVPYPNGNVPNKLQSKVTVLDINQAMLDVGKQRAIELGYDITGTGEPAIEFILGNAEELTNIESNSKDAYTIAFGIRNCTNIDKVIAEAYRVLIPGGRFMCLEFSHVQNPIFSTIYDYYSFNAIPALGGILANDKASYQYLVESIRKFPSQEVFAEMISNAGFEAVEFENLMDGIATIHSGFKPKPDI